MFLEWGYYSKARFRLLIGHMHPLTTNCVLLHHLSPKLGECVISRLANLHIWQRCVPPLNPHWHSANQHDYIVTNMEIQNYILFCNCFCYKSPAESSSLPSRFWRKSSHLGNRDFRHLFSVSWRLLGRG